MKWFFWLAVLMCMGCSVAPGSDDAMSGSRKSLREIPFFDMGGVHSMPTREDLVRQDAQTIEQSQSNQLNPGAWQFIGDLKNSPKAKTAYIIATATNPDGSYARFLTSTSVTENPWILGRATLGTAGTADDVVFDMPLNRLIVIPFGAEEGKFAAQIVDEQIITAASIDDHATQLFATPVAFPFDIEQNVTVRCWLSDEAITEIQPVSRWVMATPPGAGTGAFPLAQGAKTANVYGDATLLTDWFFNIETLSGVLTLGPFPPNGNPIDIPPNAISIGYTVTGATMLMAEQRMAL